MAREIERVKTRVWRIEFTHNCSPIYVKARRTTVFSPTENVEEVVVDDKRDGYEEVFTKETAREFLHDLRKLQDALTRALSALDKWDYEDRVPTVSVGGPMVFNPSPAIMAPFPYNTCGIPPTDDRRE